MNRTNRSGRLNARRGKLEICTPRARARRPRHPSESWRRSTLQVSVGAWQKAKPHAESGNVWILSIQPAQPS